MKSEIDMFKTVKAFLMLDDKGKRIIAKYYTDELADADRESFEQKLFEKTDKKSGDIIMLDSFVVLYKNKADINIYVLGSLDENELLLSNVLSVFMETLTIMFRSSEYEYEYESVIDKKLILENLDYVLLAVDELLDEGIILEGDAELIATRVSMKTEGDVPLSEQTISQALRTAREQIKKTL